MIKTKEARFAFILVILSLIFYGLTCCQTLYPRDSSEFALAFETWGVPHAPGYPLYVFLGHLFVKLFPFGSIPFRANFLSSIYGSLTLFVLFFIVLKIVKNHLLSFLLILYFGTSRLFWYYTGIADVFTLHTLFISLISFMIFYEEELTLKYKSYLFIFFAIFGLGLGHHHTFIFLSLAVLVHFIPQFKYQWKKYFTFTAVAATSFFLFYILITIRANFKPYLNWGDPSNFENFWRMLLRKDFGTFSLSQGFERSNYFVQFLDHVIAYFFSLKNQFQIPGLLFLLGGFYYSYKKEKSKFHFLLLASLGFVLGILIPLGKLPLDGNMLYVTEKFYLASFLILFLFVSYGFKGLAERSQNIAVSFLVILLIMLNLTKNFSINSKFNYNLHEKYLHDLFSNVEKNGILLTVNDSIVFGGWYFQEVEHRYNHLVIAPMFTSPIFENQFASRFPFLFDSPITADPIFTKVFGRDQLPLWCSDLILRNFEKRPLYYPVSELNFYAIFKNYLRPNGLSVRISSQFFEYNPQDYQYLKNILNNIETPQIKDNHYLKNEILTSYADGYNFAGLSAVKYSDLSEASSYFLKALSLVEKPNYQGNINALGEIRESLSKNSLSPVGKSNLALRYHILGADNLALPLYEESAPHLSDNLNLQSDYANTLLNLGKFKEAFQKVDEILKRDPNHPNAQILKKVLETYLP